MTLPEERRHKRSDDPLVALYHQLSCARQDACLDAFVLADDSGVVVAAAGPWAACEELAAYAPLLAHADGADGADAHSDGPIAALKGQVDVRRVDVGGQTVLLCARGQGARAAALEKTAAAVARILGRAA